MTGGRKRAAVELIAREGDELRRTAARYSLCQEDAEDAYQRALEILLLKAPSERPRDLIRWTKTVVKHEALAIRANRERLLGEAPPPGEEDTEDRMERIPAGVDSPDERLARRELVARSREALSALKPAELRALTLLAAGYSYTEIGEKTGFSRTKVNRCLAEGRERFRRVVAETETGSRCAELRPLLSAVCDEEAGEAETAAVREHLRACPGCRAAMRAYRTAPAALAALAPVLPLSRPLAERAQELLVVAQSRLPGPSGGAETGATQLAAAGGSRGAGMAALAKLLTVCAGTAGGAAACLATGVAPLPLDRPAERPAEAAAERPARTAEPEQVEAPAPEPVVTESKPEPPPEPEPEPEPEPAPEPEPEPAPEPVPTYSEASSEAGAVEYEAASAPAAQASGPEPSSGSDPGGSAGSAAGEFGP